MGERRTENATMGLTENGGVQNGDHGTVCIKRKLEPVKTPIESYLEKFQSLKGTLYY